MTKSKSANRELAEGKWKHFQIDSEDILFTISGTIGRSAIVKADDLPLLMNTSVVRFRPTSEELDRGFLYYHVRTKAFIDELKGYSTGTAIKNVGPSHLKKMEISFPPLPEQKRIVAILDEAFAGISRAVANAEKNLANARELFESYLNNVFTQKGEGWKEKTVSEIADCCLGKMLDKKKNKGSPKPYLRNINVRWFGVDVNDLLEMRFEKGEEDRYSVKSGDLVICEGGYPGRAAIWEGGEPIYFQKAIHRVRAKLPLHNRWILYFLYLSDVTGELRQYFTGAGIQHFTGKALKGFRLPLAPDEEIEAYLNKFDSLFEKTQHLEKIYQQKLTALAELKQSLLQKAFAGELTAGGVALRQGA